jgi:hypothetical protein
MQKENESHNSEIQFRYILKYHNNISEYLIIWKKQIDVRLKFCVIKLAHKNYFYEMIDVPLQNLITEWKLTNSFHF